MTPSLDNSPAADTAHSAAALAPGQASPATPNPDRQPATLAVVIPILNEQDNLPELCRRISQTCQSLSDMNWKVVFVDDGSTDRTAAMIAEQHARDPRFTLVSLSRNFGHQEAIACGLAHADADAVVIMDGDLQDPPELIPDLVAAWRDGGQVVIAQRRSRQDRGLRRLGYDGFHKLFGWLTDFPIPPNTGVFGLMDRLAVTEMVRLSERSRFLPGLRSWIGFEQRIVLYDRQGRTAGVPGFTFRKLIRYALNAIFSFSYKPLRLMMITGAMVSLIGFLLACTYVVLQLTNPGTIGTGFTTLITVILFLGGIQLIAIGLLGEYLGRVFDEVKARPLYIVKKRLGLPQPRE